MARIVKEVVNRSEPDVRWFLFGDDDTVFFMENLVRTLSKYDHDRWFYVGSNSFAVAVTGRVLMIEEEGDEVGLKSGWR
ncbi:hypothetical protein C1H46_001632 [Malus baccata]|uniref:Fringe-like glycosyltransferase domain-containing protein n=1 Tax=Malus baccata TaxID=106549 RepID=A0A540NP11_MALBA|nr:hypothetical protein C1H46_001632 [Malus baccata]